MSKKIFCLVSILLLNPETGGVSPENSDSSEIFRPYLAGLVVADASRSAEWYQRNLGFEVTRRMTFPLSDSLVIIFLKRGAAELELIQKRNSFSIRKYLPDFDQEKTPLQGIAKVAFMVDDVSQLADSLRAGGVRILFGPFDDRALNLKSVIIEDPDGNVLQFSELRQAGFRTR